MCFILFQLSLIQYRYNTESAYLLFAWVCVYNVNDAKLIWIINNIIDNDNIYFMWQGTTNKKCVCFYGR